MAYEVWLSRRCRRRPSHTHAAAAGSSVFFLPLLEFIVSHIRLLLLLRRTGFRFLILFLRFCEWCQNDVPKKQHLKFINTKKNARIERKWLLFLLFIKLETFGAQVITIGIWMASIHSGCSSNVFLIESIGGPDCNKPEKWAIFFLSFLYGNHYLLSSILNRHFHFTKWGPAIDNYVDLPSCPKTLSSAQLYGWEFAMYFLRHPNECRCWTRYSIYAWLKESNRF